MRLKNPEMSYGYADSPPYSSVGILPHAIGTVGAVKVPWVNGNYKLRGDYPYFLCVDYLIDGQRYRVGTSYKNVRKVKNASDLSDI